MSIQTKLERFPTGEMLSPSWGELASADHGAVVVKFLLVGRIVTYPVSELRRWEHVLVAPEALRIALSGEVVVVEGRDLSAIRIALDVGRLQELRVNYPAKTISLPGPQVRRISIEAE